MSNKYQLLADLDKLRQNGSISEEEYQNEKQKILNSAPYQQCNSKTSDLGMEENTYLLLMHLSQFAGFLFLGLGFAAPIIMWAINKDKNENVDRHGRNIINFMLSMMLYLVVAIILTFTVIFAIIGIPMLIVIVILEVIFIILAAVKANSGEYWKYPFTIPFLSMRR